MAVASTADILRHSPSAEGWTLAAAEQLAQGAVEGREDRQEFLKLLRRAKSLDAGAHQVAAQR